MPEFPDDSQNERLMAQFMTMATHQLRTPLSGIKASVGLLIDNVGEDFQPPLKKLLSNIKDSTQRLERLLEDLFELTNLQSGRVKMQPQKFDVGDLLNQVVEASRPRFEAKQQVITHTLPEEPLYAQGDYCRISQALERLLNNASKFSPPGDRIELSVSKVGTRESPQVLFLVRDTGIGISTEEQELVFEKFYQSAVPENNAVPGAGLGLPIARTIVEQNGGRLWLESIPGQGSTFYFTLTGA